MFDERPLPKILAVQFQEIEGVTLQVLRVLVEIAAQRLKIGLFAHPDVTHREHALHFFGFGFGFGLGLGLGLSG